MAAEEAPFAWQNDIPEEDKPVVAEMKEMLAKDGISIPNPFLNNDTFIARFSRARGRKAEPAYEMLRNCLKWREEQRVDTIDEWWATSDIAKRIMSYYPAQTYWEAKDGRPIAMDHFTLTDPAIMYTVFPVEELVNYHIWVMEHVLKDVAKASEKHRRTITDAIFMFNMGGLAWKHMDSTTVALAKPTFQTDADYYPEVVAAVFICNAPKMFSVLYKLVSPFVDPRTLEKVQILGNDWKTTVGELIDDSALPSTWGGSSPVKWRNMGGSVIPGASGGASQKVNLTVAAGTAQEIEVLVQVAGSTVSWEFSTVGYDIDFFVDAVLEDESKKKKKKGKGKEEEEEKGEKEKVVVEEKKRVQSHVEAVVGKVSDAKKGTYRLVFDNTYSWTTAKTVDLAYSVDAPMKKSEIKSAQKKEKKAKGK